MGSSEIQGQGRDPYSLAREGGGTVLQASSKNAASGLLKKVKIDASEYPILRWSWKIDHTLKGEDAARKEGDDFAAQHIFLENEGYSVCMVEQTRQRGGGTQSVYFECDHRSG